MLVSTLLATGAVADNLASGVSGDSTVGGALTAPILPSGGTVAAGQATIVNDTNLVTVNQSSNKAIVNWSDFSIGKDGKVQFNNGTGATLNRVTGGNLSSIDGLLSATGSVYLINPNGVIIGKTGVVTVGGGFVASTLDVKNADFLKGGDLSFDGLSGASVINLGQVGALGGNVALIAGTVENAGTISAAKGAAGLVAGHSVLLRDTTVDGGNFLIQTGGADTSVTNTGAIRAAAIELRASGGNIFALAGNSTGILSATGVSQSDGKVYLVAEGGSLKAAGQITAVTANGDGGLVETSGQTVDFTTAKVNTNGTTGKTGTWLIDPVDLTVDAQAASAISSNLLTSNVTLQTTGNTAIGAGIQTQGLGDININSAISWNAATTLTLNAWNNININATLTSTNAAGKLALLYGQGTPAGGSTDYNVNAQVNLMAGQNFSTKQGYGAAVRQYTVITSLGQAGSTTGTDLQGINGNLTGNYVLGGDIDASVTASWNGGLGFNPVGNSQNLFLGIFDGLHHAISGLTINRPNSDNVGLFGYVGDHEIKNISLIDVSVTGKNSVGGLVGVNNYGAITNTYTTGSVVGQNQVGGVAGINYNGKIRIVYTTSSVNGSLKVGGLVGYDVDSSINNAYATGAVSGTRFVGGLLGYLSGGSITNVYATGRVIGGSAIGGLVGISALSSSISNGYYDKDTSGQFIAYYGVGLTTAQLQGSLPMGFDPSIWGTGAGMYPYLKAFGTVTPAQKVSGFAYDANGNAVTGATVGVYSGGTQSGQASSGANGYYYYLNQGSAFDANSKLGATLTLSGGGSISGATYTDSPTLTSGDVTNVNVTSGVFANYTKATTYSALQTDLKATFGTTLYNTLVSSLNTAGLKVYAANAFSIDAPLTTSGDILFKSGDDLTVASDLTFSGAQTLTLDAAKSININATITSTHANGKIALNYGQASADGAASDYNINAKVNLKAGQNFSTKQGSAGVAKSYTVITSLGQAGSTTGTDLQGINGNLTSNYVLGGDIDATSTAGWNSGAGFDPLGGASYFDGTFDGLGHTVFGLTINRADTDDVGLFGRASFSTIKNVGLINTSIKGHWEVGSLVGNFGAGNMSNVYATGDVIGSAYVGALVGAHHIATGHGSTISNAYATGTVTGTTRSENIGGLIGWNDATVSDAYANVRVTGALISGGLIGYNGATGNIINTHANGAVIAVAIPKNNSNSTPYTMMMGGLVGANYGSIDKSYSTGTVAGTLFVGGLAGINYSEIKNSYSTSTVSGYSAGSANDGYFLQSSYIGGLVGANTMSNTTYNSFGSIESSYATGSVSGNEYVGGLVGNNVSGLHGVSIDNSYATGAVTGTRYIGGLVGRNGDKVSNSYSTGIVTGVNYSFGLFDLQHNLVIANVLKDLNGGLVGDNSGEVSNSYWNTQTSGLATSAGGTGLTTAQLQGSLPTGFDPSIWGTGAGFYPYLKVFGIPVSTGQKVSGFAYDASGNAVSGATVGVYSGGAQSGSASSGANGYYYYLNQGAAFDANSKLGATLTLSGSSAISGATYTDSPTLTSGDVTNLNVTSGVFANYTKATTYSALQTDLKATFGNTLYNTLVSSLNTGALKIYAANAFTVDSALNRSGDALISVTGNLALAGNITAGNTTLISSTGSLSQTAGVITTATLSGSAAGSASLTGANKVTTLKDFTAGTSLAFTNAQALTATNVKANGGALTLTTTAGDLTVSGTQASTLQTLKSANDILMSADLTLTGSQALTLDAAHGIALNGNVVASGANAVSLTINNGLSGGDLTYGAGKSLSFTGTANSGQSLKLNGASYQLVYSLSDLQALNNTSGKYALAKSLDASGRTYSDAVVKTFNGSFTGLGNSITNLKIYSSYFERIGLFGTLSGTASVSDLGLSGSVTGGNYTGALAGFNGGTLKNIKSSVAVKGFAFVGGLAGQNTGTITKSAVSGTTTGDAYVGGVTGWNTGTVSVSYNTGAIKGSDMTGGLVGWNFGSVNNAYSTGAVTGNVFVGGLVGYNFGNLNSVYSTGKVIGNVFTGGLVGSNIGAVSNAYWDTQTSGQATSAAGTGKTTAQLKAGLPSGFISSIWDSTSGAYPTLKGL